MGIYTIILIGLTKSIFETIIFLGEGLFYMPSSIG
jgi:hypothetical protein